jgi:hypothetical protein
VAPDLERAEHAAYADAFRASPDFCEVAEIDGGTCLAVRRLPGRIFNRVFGLKSAGALDEIAAFYGDTEWWVSDSAGLGGRARAAWLRPRLRLDEILSQRRAARGAERPPSSAR